MFSKSLGLKGFETGKKQPGVSATTFLWSYGKQRVWSSCDYYFSNHILDIILQLLDEKRKEISSPLPSVTNKWIFFLRYQIMDGGMPTIKWIFFLRYQIMDDGMPKGIMLLFSSYIFCRYQNADWRLRPLPVEMMRYHMSHSLVSIRLLHIIVVNVYLIHTHTHSLRFNLRDVV